MILDLRIQTLLELEDDVRLGGRGPALCVANTRPFYDKSI
jgi:hypothetical protein